MFSLDFAFIYFTVLAWVWACVLLLSASVLAVCFARAHAWGDRFAFAGMWVFCVLGAAVVVLTYL